MNMQLSNDLRKQAQALLSSANKLVEAADILDSLGNPLLPTAENALTIKQLIHDNLQKIGRTQDNKLTQPEALRQILGSSLFPLSRQEIYAKMIDQGYAIKLRDVSTMLSRMKKQTGEFESNDGKWSIAKKSA
jgi:hypothetical protein